MTPRDAWNAFKGAALQRRDGAAPHAKCAAEALDVWAAAPSSATREERELRCASIVGALATDFAIAKLASVGRITPEEQQYLLDLNAEAALADLATLTKRADFSQRIVNGLATLAQHPKTTGAVVGGAIGGGIGAWKDDENRLRGAALYAVPGAVIGGIGGALGGDLLNQHLYRSVESDAMGKAHAIAQGAQPLIDAASQDALALAKRRTEGEAARRASAVVPHGRENTLNEMESFDQALRARAQINEARPLIDEMSQDAVALAKKRIEGELARSQHVNALKSREGALKEFERFDQTLSERTQAAAEAAAANVAGRNNALGNIRQREIAAKHLHASHLQAADQIGAMHVDARIQQQAREIAGHLRAREDEIISHAMANPGQIHPEIDLAHYDKPGAMREIRDLAARVLSRGPT